MTVDDVRRPPHPLTTLQNRVAQKNESTVLIQIIRINCGAIIELWTMDKIDPEVRSGLQCRVGREPVGGAAQVHRNLLKKINWGNLEAFRVKGRVQGREDPYVMAFQSEVTAQGG
jgi:hypothetical protein